MIENSESEISDEALASKEREVAALFCALLAESAVDETESMARQTRIMDRVRSDAAQDAGRDRIGRILHRIQTECVSRNGDVEPAQEIPAPAENGASAKN